MVYSSQLNPTEEMMQVFQYGPELVSKTKTGNNKFWRAEVLTDGTNWYTGTTFWQVNKAGKKSVVQTSTPYIATLKNIGKANETTPQQQALLEFDSIIKKQRDKGYSEEGIEHNGPVLPMLAHSFSGRKNKITYPVYVQRKYNGNRMLFDGTKGWSRAGKYNIPAVIEHFLFDTKGHILDGEIMLPGNVLLQHSMKAIKKFVPEVSPTLQYIVYDIVDANKSFSDRQQILKSLLAGAPKNVILAPTEIAHNEEEVSALHSSYVTAGFEGTMIRTDATYEIGARSYSLLKLKDMQDAEFKIIDIQSGVGSYEGCAIFVCATATGGVFNCNPEGTMEYKRNLYKIRKSLINEYLTVRFQELSKDGCPLFPIGVMVRDAADL